jgi:hypothetical protein
MTSYTNTFIETNIDGAAAESPDWPDPAEPWALVGLLPPGCGPGAPQTPCPCQSPECGPSPSLPLALRPPGTSHVRH